MLDPWVIGYLDAKASSAVIVVYCLLVFSGLGPYCELLLIGA